MNSLLPGPLSPLFNFTFNENDKTKYDKEIFIIRVMFSFGTSDLFKGFWSRKSFLLLLLVRIRSVDLY